MGNEHHFRRWTVKDYEPRLDPDRISACCNIRPLGIKIEGTKINPIIEVAGNHPVSGISASHVFDRVLVERLLSACVNDFVPETDCRAVSADGISTAALLICFDAFSSCEPEAASLENAMLGGMLQLTPSSLPYSSGR